MRTIKVIRFAVSALLLASASSFAAGTIVGTGHDLSMSALLPADGTVDNGEMCVYCHTPHKTQPEAPLWNRAISASTFTLYDNTVSPTINMITGQPGAGSMLCLGCHDGVTALDTILNAPNSGWTPATTARTMSAAAAGYFGTDLSDDHPIGITYSVAADPEFNITTAVATALGNIDVTQALPGGKVECSSCHSVHDTTNMPFLRISNDNSALCLACHKK